MTHKGVTHDVKHDWVGKLWRVVGHLAWHPVAQLHTGLDELILGELTVLNLTQYRHRYQIAHEVQANGA